MVLKTYLAHSPFAALVLAHGAGAGQMSPFMVRTATGLAERGLSVATFDFAYMSAKRSVPGRPPVLEQSWRDAVAAARVSFGALPLFIGGKSMGGRISSHVAAQGGLGDIRGLVLLGYPLHPPGKPEKRRDGHLPQVAEPMLFVQGSRDTFGTGDEMRLLLLTLPRATLFEIPAGDHGFKAPKSQGTPEVIMAGVMDAVVAFARTHAGDSRVSR